MEYNLFMSMQVKLLNNVVEKLIKPKYPWIKKFEWNQTFHDGLEWYNLDIFPDRILTSWTEVIYKQEIKNEMNSIFSMLGPEPNERFLGVWFKY